MAAALSEEDFIFVWDVHDAAGLGDGVAKDGAKFWRAVGERHGAEALGGGVWEASLADGGFDGGRKVGGAW